MPEPLVVAVRAPTGKFQVYFDIAGQRRVVAKLNDRAAEIGAAFAAEKTRVKNSDGSSVECFELLAPQALVSPDSLK